MTINLSDVVGITLNGSSVVKIEDTLGNILWQAGPAPDPSTEYFYVQNLSNTADTISITKNHSSAPTLTVYYSTDKTNWTGITTSTTSTPISIPANSRVYFKSTSNSWGGSSDSYYNRFGAGSSSNYAVGGNIMSLIYGDDFAGKTAIKQYDNCFNCLFSTMPGALKNINNLVLPATTLYYGCYRNMFVGCASLTSIPSSLLPATTLTEVCYNGMFSNCTSLTNVPSNLLPATTLTEGCYSGMFGNCTSLTSVPNLPATTLANNCYYYMFNGCTGLTSVPENLLPATTLADSCYSGMFQSCSRLTNVPNLPATTLAASCYLRMFSNCRGLTSVPFDLLPATTLATGCYSGMFISTAITKAPKLPATTLVNQCYYQMFYLCRGLNEIVCSANNISATNCTYQWVQSVASSGTFYKLGSASWTLNSVNGVPTGWTVETEYPDNTYFYVENLTNSANTLTITKSSSSLSEVLVYYSTDQTTWTSMGYTTVNGITYSIPANSKVYLKANTDKWGQTMFGYNYISASDDFSVGGNIMSLLYGDNFRGQTTIPTPSSSYGKPAAFYGLFHGANKLKSINNLVLPATTLTDYCYFSMFDRCKGLTSIPSNLLPATTLQRSCYGSMFSFCTGLTTIPSTLLHSTTLADSCYSGMFEGCYGLTSIPSNLLPATTLASDCYTFMFDNCTGLTNIPSTLLHSTTLASHCYWGMFRSCTGITTIPSNLLPATTLTEYCYNSMFSGCTGLTSTPNLPATTLATGCYGCMFANCSSLNKVICYANDISATDCTSQWLSGVSRYGTFYKLGSANWAVGGDSGIPLYWTVETEYSELTYFYLTNTGSNNATIGLTHTVGGEEMMWEGFNGGTIYYSTDQNNWNEWGRYVLNIDSDPETGVMSATWDGGITDTITLTPNQKLYFRCNGPMMVENEMGGMYMDEPIGQFFTMNGNTNIQAGGNIWSMRYGQNFTTSEGINLIGPIFDGCTILKNIDSLSICNNNMTLAGGVLARLFKNTGITSIPSGFFDNAVNLGGSSYGYPEGVFYQMFMGCTGLTTINGSYIFYVPTLYTTNGGTANYCYASMFEGCSSLNMSANPPKLFNNDLVVSSDSVSQSFYSMFKGCTSLTKTPIINVETSDTTSGQYEVFSSMFYGCTNLARVDFYNSQSSHGWSSEFTDWLYNVAGTGDFYTNTGMTWTTNSTSGIPSGWTRHDLGA